MRRALVCAALLAACGPSAGGPDGARPDGGTGDDGGPPDAACAEVAMCGVELRYAGAATSVEVRGDFGAPIAMTRDGDAWVATIPDRVDRRTFQYTFFVDGARTETDPENPRLVPDGAGGYRSVGLATCDACPAPPFDWRDAVIYFVVTDRFVDGDPANDAPVVGVPAESNWQGGDLAGLLTKIEDGTFERLGVNALWITAPLANAQGAELGKDGQLYTAYHGYWTTDPEAVDPRYGDRALYARVVDAAHAHGLRVIVDYVMNHVHDSSPVYAAHADWFHPLDQCGVCGDGDCSWDLEPDREQCWFRDYLPDYNFADEAARYASVSNAIRWARDLGLDGYRLDAVKHIADSWVEDLRARAKVELEAGGQPFYLVGETFTGDRGDIARYVAPTRLDGQFDFPLRAALVRSALMKVDPMSTLAGFLDGNDGFYGEGAIMGTFLGNHDLPRVVHLAEAPPQFTEWDGGHARSWEDRPTQPTDAAAYERLRVAYTILYTLPGVPVVYYGDEIAMAGGGDPDNRKMWPADDAGLLPGQLALREHLAALGKLRAAEPALRRGRRVTRGSSDDVLVYARLEGTSRIFVVANRGDAAAPATGLTAGNYVDLLDGTTRSAPLDVPARTAWVLRPTE